MRVASAQDQTEVLKEASKRVPNSRVSQSWLVDPWLIRSRRASFLIAAVNPMWIGMHRLGLTRFSVAGPHLLDEDRTINERN